jgi:exopolysaccharide production protein ExoY
MHPQDVLPDARSASTLSDPAPSIHREAFPAQRVLREPGRGYWIAKRCIDVLLALVLLLVFGIIYVVIGFLIICQDGFPILYAREAIGLHGKKFRLYKFRSMHKHADEYLRQHSEKMAEFQRDMKLKDDPRLIRIGRFIRRLSIDEVPQVLNVLRGEMSFVGPRYVTQEEIERYGVFADLRIDMMPGITGLWQISGRNEIPYDQRVIYDRTYYYTRSIKTDLSILVRTIPAVLSRRGAY